MRTKIVIVAITLAASAAALYIPAAEEPEEPRLYTPHLFDAGRGRSDAPAVPHDYDVKEYVIDITLDDAQRKISGSCKITATSSKDNLREVQFNLESDMNVTAVKQAGENRPYTHNGAVLKVTLRSPKARGEDFTLTVRYNGQPRDGLYFTNKGVYVTSAMEEAQHWFPCYDSPDDKADRVELIVTCRDDWYVAGNGLLESERNNGNGTKTYKWVTARRIATYLLSISGAYNYSRFGTTWSGVPIDYYVFPEHRANAEICFEHVKPMMNFFSNRFWRYPFDDERYGIAEAEMGTFGAMENQTCITLNSYYVRPDHSSDHILAHELSHMWWGDCISPGSWKDLWLTEGFGTYCDALWEEHDKGKAAFQARMQTFASQYFAEDARTRFPVYDPAYPWSATVYQKGAWVMHMLRRRLGDAKFFRAWNKYGADHTYGHAFTTELQRAMEDEYGLSLQRFFNNWVYKAGYPEFEYDWSTAGNGVTVDICQVQTQTPLTPLFEAPIDLTITTRNDGTHVETVWVRDRFHRFTFNYGSAVTNVEFDKEGWVLCKKSHVVGLGVTAFEASPAPGAVKLIWKTSPGTSLAGFNLYRSTAGGRRHKLNASLVTGRSPYEFRDAAVEPDTGYRYWLEAVALNGERETFGPVESRAGDRRPAFALEGNYPNPVRGTTTFTFTLPAPAEAALRVYDMAGREVWSDRGTYDAGRQEWEATFDLAPGVYVYRLEVAKAVAARRMVVVK